MLVINRNTFEIEEYRKCKNIEVGLIQFWLLDLLQSGKEIHYGQLMKWIELKMGKTLSSKAIYQQLYRLQKYGIYVDYKKGYYQLKEKEVWLV